MLEKTKKIIIIASVSFVILVQSGVILYLLLKPAPTQPTITDIKKAVKVKKNADGTQILPPAPQLEYTLDDLEKDIIGKKK